MGLTSRCGSWRYTSSRSLINLPPAFMYARAANNSGQWRSLGHRWKATRKLVSERDEERSKASPTTKIPVENLPIENS